MKVIAVMPAYNEEAHIEQVIKETRKYVDQVVVVDDASMDSTPRLARDAKATVVSHESNRGLGGALRTGIDVALNHGADVIVTLDADGQHDPAEIPAIIKPILDGKAEMVVGSRMLVTQGSMPLVRRVSNTISSWIVRAVAGVLVTDSQSGFRGFDSSALEKMSLTSQRMEISTEFILEAGRVGLRVREVPIKSIYGEEKSHFRNVRDTLQFAKLLLVYITKRK